MYACETISVEGLPAQSEILIYPNPAIEEFFIKSNLSGQYSILALSGRQVLSGRIDAGGNKINIGNLCSGIYIVKLIAADEVIFGRLVKQ